MSYEAKGLAALAHDDLPLQFTQRDFHAVMHSIYGYCESTSKGILSRLKRLGYVETIRRPTGFVVALYAEKRVKK